MGRFWNQENLSIQLATVFMIGLEHLDSHKFSLGSSDRLSRDRCKTSDRFEPFLGFEKNFQAALHIFDRCLWVHVGKPFQSSSPFINIWIVLHRAGTQWVASLFWADIEVS